MTALAEKRCFLHPAREAAARCPSCGRFFCRECVTEHEGRMSCARCLAALSARPGERRSRAASLLAAAAPLAGLLAAWATFFYLGRILLAIPSSFHEGTFLLP